MKQAVSFLYNCKKYIVNLFKKSSSITLVVVVMVLLGLSFIKTPKIFNGLLAFATNVREEMKINIEVSDLLKAYPVLNGDNYILAESKQQQEVEKVEKAEVKEDKQVAANTELFDASAVDVFSNIITIDKNEITRKNTSNYTRVNIGSITIYDYSSKKIDYEELMSMELELKKGKDNILIYSTHTSETYTNSDTYKFSYSGTYRSRDGKYNMLSVAHILNKTLNERGIDTVFDTTAHDYTSYDSAYKNSMKTIEKNLEAYKDFGLIIDVHRDAAGDLTFGPETTINGKKTAMLMLVVGVGYDGLENPYWKENLSLALRIASVGEKMYPGLFRQVLVRDSRYNQHLIPGSILVEVGATGNTLEEAYYGVRCLGNILGNIYK